MACADNDLTMQESDYFAALNNATAFELSVQELIITYDDEKQLTFTPLPTITVVVEAGEGTVELVVDGEVVTSRSVSGATVVGLPAEAGVVRAGDTEIEVEGATVIILSLK
jgi:hypothetical protein